MNLYTMMFRTVFFYFFILIIYRFMGKREMGSISVQDLVVGILIAEMVAISIENTKESLILTVVPILLLVFLEIIVAFLSLKSNTFRHLVDGKPVLLINKGIINFKEMIKQRYTIDDLLVELRNNNIKNLMDVEYAVLENNGKLSIFKYNFMKRSSSNPFPLILDGKIEKSALEYIKKDEEWLKSIIYEEGYRVEDIFYCFYKNNKAFIISKESIKN